LEESDIDMMIGASRDSIAMVEGEMKEISEKEMVEAIKFAHEHIKVQIDAQERLAAAFERKKCVNTKLKNQTRKSTPK
jgi:polyribonucleotide nucleotidyltransferase